MPTDFGNEDRAAKALDWQAIPIIPVIPMGFRSIRTNSEKSISLCILANMFADYRSLVVLDYQKKRETNTLPPTLIRPSPARLRAACLAVCEERFSPKDLPTLRTFFGSCNDKQTCLQAIAHHETDKFRPMVNFLKESTMTPDDKNIELLAWLIDFTPRPHVFGRRYDLNSVEKESLAPPSDPNESAPTPKQKKIAAVFPQRKIRRILLPVGLLLVIAIGLSWLINNVSTRPHVCMFWAGDHYQPIPCGQKPGDALVLPLDSEKIAHFKKITRPDTITENALGSIWCVKYHNVYECYTDSGYHPIDTTLKLRLLKDYVLLRYIHPGLQPAQLTTDR